MAVLEINDCHDSVTSCLCGKKGNRTEKNVAHIPVICSGVTSSREYLVHWVSTCRLFSINTVFERF